jgi:hypothetical protein
VAPEEFRPCDFDSVRNLVEEKLRPEAEKVDGGYEELLLELSDKRALCWRSKDAVLVLSLAPTSRGERDLFVRAMVSIGASTDAIDEHLPHVERIAKDLGAARIRFRTMRRGFERAVGSRWRVSHTEYVTDVESA